VDIKIIVASSSVVHMNFKTCSLFSLLKIEVLSSVIVIISHGLYTSLGYFIWLTYILFTFLWTVNYFR